MEVIKGVQRRQSANPRTVLGFFAIVLGLMFTAAVSASAVLAETHTLTNLIPYVLGFAAIILVLVLLGIFVVMLTDPSKLMLGQITGSEYVEIHKLMLGDSLVGERQEALYLPEVGARKVADEAGSDQ